MAAVVPTPPPLVVGDLSAPEGMLLYALDDKGQPDTTKPLPEVSEFLTLANTKGMTKEETGQLLALHTKFLQSAASEYLGRWEKTQADWQTAVRALPEYGGANLPATLTSIAKTLDRYGDAKVREAFAVTGAGNHPDIVRFMAKLSKDLNETPPVRGDQNRGLADRATRMYPTAVQG